VSNIVPFQPSNAEVYRASTDAASLCKDIVLRTVMEIQKRRYVKVEGWQAIAVAHGCMAGSGDVEVLDDGVKAVGEIRRMSDGQLLARAEGFVGKDEPTWYGGTMRRWKWGQQRGEKVWYDEEMPKRSDYAIRAMAQTRAISRACRSAFAHVVVLIDANLSTTPAEEVPLGGWDDQPADQPASDHPNAPKEARQPQPKPAQAGPRAGGSPTAPPQDEASQASRRAAAPAPKRTIVRQGSKVPAPTTPAPQDWVRWQRVVARKVEEARSADEIRHISELHGPDVIRSNEVLPGSAESFAELVSARLADMERAA
jgi:hypothetical protein